MTRQEPQDKAVTYSYYLIVGSDIQLPGRVQLEVSTPEEAMEAVSRAVWESDQPKVHGWVQANGAGPAPVTIGNAIKSEDGEGARYQIGAGEWREWEMVYTPEEAARRSIVAIFDSTHIYPQNVDIVELSSSRSLSMVGSVDALDVTYRQWFRQIPESVLLYLAQLRTLPQELLRSHLNKVEGTGRIITPLRNAIHQIDAHTAAFGPIRVHRPTLFMDRSSQKRGGLRQTSFGGAVVLDFTRLLGILSAEELESWRRKYEKLPATIRQQVEIFHGTRHGARGAGFVLETIPVVEPIKGARIPVVNATGDEPADTGPGKYALVETQPHVYKPDEPWKSRTYRYIVRMPDNAESPNGHLPTFPYDYMQPATVETFRVPAGRTLSEIVLHDTPAYRSAEAWVPRTGANGKPSGVLVHPHGPSIG